MSRKTLSEKLFEEFCTRNLISFKPISPRAEPEQKTPDYQLILQNEIIVVEVKQIDPNRTDIKNEQLLEKTGMTDVMGSEPGSRVRAKINDAVPQLYSLAKGKYPAVLVLYCNIKLERNYVDPYNILVGMHGLETFTITLPRDAKNNLRITRHYFGSKQKVSPKHNTTLSAIASLYEPLDGSGYLRLDIYHNEHANIPFVPNLLRIPSVRHFKRHLETGREFGEWVEL